MKGCLKSKRPAESLTHAFFLPLVLHVCDRSVQALLHAFLVRQLPLQPLVSSVQLAVQRELLILVDFGCFLQDVNLRKKIHFLSVKKTKFSPIIHTLTDDFVFVLYLVFIHL